jgi:hypothetical protein
MKMPATNEQLEHQPADMRIEPADPEQERAGNQDDRKGKVLIGSALIESLHHPVPETDDFHDPSDSGATP